MFSNSKKSEIDPVSIFQISLKFKKSKISDRGGGSSLFWKKSKIFPFFNYEISPYNCAILAPTSIVLMSVTGKGPSVNWSLDCVVLTSLVIRYNLHWLLSGWWHNYSCSFWQNYLLENYFPTKFQILSHPGPGTPELWCPCLGAFSAKHSWKMFSYEKINDR